MRFVLAALFAIAASWIGPRALAAHELGAVFVVIELRAPDGIELRLLFDAEHTPPDFVDRALSGNERTDAALERLILGSQLAAGGRRLALERVASEPPTPGSPLPSRSSPGRSPARAGTVRASPPRPRS